MVLSEFHKFLEANNHKTIEVWSHWVVPFALTLIAVSTKKLCLADSFS